MPLKLTARRVSPTALKVCAVAVLTTWLIVLYVSLADAQQAGAPAAEPALEPQPGLILLKNGQALSGKIAKSGNRYLVWLPDGEIRLTAEQVDLVCRDLEDGYRQKQARIDPTRVDGHLILADWCLHHRLWDHARGELAAARAIDPKHPRVALLERRLELGQNAPQAVPPEAAVDADENAGPTSDELDRLVRELPEGTVETFMHKIQPLLVNNCTASGCHGPRSETRYSLLRLSAGRLPNRRLTQRNLWSTMEWLQPQQPLASPLLRYPVAAHGGAKAPVFANREAVQYQQLVQWVQQVSGKPAQPVVAQQPANQQPAGTSPANPAVDPAIRLTSGETVTPITQPAGEQPPAGAAPTEGQAPAPSATPGPRRPLGTPRQGLKVGPRLLPGGDDEASLTPTGATPTVPAPRTMTPAAGSLPEAADPFGVLRSPAPQPRPAFPTIHDVPHRSEAKRGASVTEFQAADPFDPEVFNRKYFGK